MQLSVTQAIDALRADVMQRGDASDVRQVSIDSRTLQAGDWFVAIRGAHFDGHQFAAVAAQRGARVIVAARDAARALLPTLPGSATLLAVDDTQVALGALAHAWRATLDAARVIAITGSNGKSTTKEMTASIAAACGAVCKTQGNLNNLIGLPLTLFRAMPSDEVLVLEMGMSARGEIAAMTDIARPDIGIITNVSAAHLETLHTIENVAEAKGELFAQLRPGTTMIVNREDALICRQAAKYADRRQITFGMQNDCDVQFGHMDTDAHGVTALSVRIRGATYHTTLPLPGTHNVMNAMAAMATGVALEIAPDEMMERLAHFAPMKMRMERVQLANGVQVINDCYNANPASMQMALRTFSASKRAGRFVAVLGDMLELGPQAVASHEALGRQVAEYGVDHLFAVGPHAADVVRGAAQAGRAATTLQTAARAELITTAVAEFVRPGDVVLVKGSRGMRMEQVIDYLKDACGLN